MNYDHVIPEILEDKEEEMEGEPFKDETILHHLMRVGHADKQVILLTNAQM